MIIPANMDVDKDIQDALSYIKYMGIRQSNTFLHTNENIPEVMKHLNLRGQNILSVAASGEQVLCFSKEKPQLIDTFDINSLAYYVMALTIAAKYMLTQEEYEAFIPQYSNFEIEKNYFDKSLYKKTRVFLPDDAKEFWDYIYKYISNKNQTTNRILFLALKNQCQSRDTYDFLKRHDKTIKENLPKIPITFSNIDITKNNNTFPNSEYGSIYLSNIYSYIQTSESIFPNLPAKEQLRMLRIIRKDLYSLLNNDGRMLVYYCQDFLQKNPFMYLLPHINCNEIMSQYDFFGRTENIIIPEKIYTLKKTKKAPSDHK